MKCQKHFYNLVSLALKNIINSSSSIKYNIYNVIILEQKISFKFIIVDNNYND